VTDKEKKVDDSPDPTPLVEALLEKTRAGKVKWEPTANRTEFLATLGDTSVKLLLASDWEQNPETGNVEPTDIPAVELLDQKGKRLWFATAPRGKGEVFWSLYKAGQRIGNRLDERISSVLETLEKL
jgi:hypothetical protein